MSTRRDEGFTDYAQIAVTSLYVHWRRARAVENTDGYARAILVRAFLGERRPAWSRRVSLGGELPDLPGAQADPDAVMDVRTALLGLPPRQRATIVLRYYCDLNVDQAAHALGCSAGTVKSQTAKALSALRAVLGEADAPFAAQVSGRQRRIDVGEAR